MSNAGLRLPTSAGLVLDRALATEPAREALVAADARLTYEELDAAVDRAAASFAECGVRRGDVIAVSMPNTSEVVTTFHAAMRLGAVWLGINQNLAPSEKQFILEDSDARVFLTCRAAAETLADRAGAGARRRTMVAGEPAGEWPQMLADTSLRYVRVTPEHTDPAGIAYTSGTTGRPKAVVHSHRGLLLPGAVLVQARGFGPSLRKGDCAALTILNLQVTSTLLVAQACGTQIAMDRVDPEGIARWVRREAINTWFGVPTMLHGLARSADVAVADLASLAEVWTGGTWCPEPIRASFEDRFGTRVCATYGLTEAPTIVTIESQSGPRVQGSSGVPLPHLVVEVRDDAGNVLGPGVLGEITVRAQDHGDWAHLYEPMIGYRGQPKATAATVRGGVLYTGDVGELDGDGELLVRDRRHALILRGGANVYPAEVERVLMDLDGVRGASVVGIPDERLGQRVAAAIELDDGASVEVPTLAEHCASHLARYKVPERWRVATLPRNAMGKVVRPEVERLFSEEDETRSPSREAR